MATEVRAISATGMLGSGFPAESLTRAMTMNPDFIGCDSGSTDSGPHALGAGESHMPREAWKRDMRLMLEAGRAAGIPVIVGSTGSAGGRANLDWGRQIVEEIARETGLHFRLATIDSEQEPEFIAQRMSEGRVIALATAPDADPEYVRGLDHIVALMGAEPIQAALENGADVVLAGRSTDTAIYSAIPLSRGIPPATSWHAAKLLECGAAPVEHRLRPDCMFAVITEDATVLSPPNPKLRCTALSVAAHTLYENGDPYHLYEPSGMLDTTNATYEQLPDNRSVRIAGSTFHHADRYTVKLEAARLVGYQAFAFGGIRDSAVLRELDLFLDACLSQAHARVRDLYGSSLVPDTDYAIRLVVYGRNAVMGSLEPHYSSIGHEIGLMIEATARESLDLAKTIVGLAQYMVMHNPVSTWKGFTTNIAFPSSPSSFRRGPLYQFALNHLLELDSPMEVFKAEFIDV